MVGVSLKRLTRLKKTWLVLSHFLSELSLEKWCYGEVVEIIHTIITKYAIQNS